jgi:hypothetical protein
MSNPEPDLPPSRNRRRHIGPLVGMVLVVVFALSVMAWWLAESTARAPGPDSEPGLSEEEGMAPPASPGEGGVDPAAVPGDAGGTDAVGDPAPDGGADGP